MVCGIYEIRNIENDDLYIGSTKFFRKRERQHFNALEQKIHTNVFLQNAYNKYGKEAFVFSILLECEETELFERETEFIERLSPRYNLMSASCGRFLHSAESKEKAAAKMRERWLDPNFRQSQMEKFKSRPKITEETKRLMSISSKGKKKVWKSGSHPNTGKISHLRGMLGEACYVYGRRGAQHPSSKSVDQLDKDSGELIATFETVGAACLAVNLKSRTDIARAIEGVRQKTAGGFRWRYHVVKTEDDSGYENTEETA